MLFSADWRQRFRRRLVAWYRRHARDLPWRRSRDPYRVWISEIMLQQTQVATVEPYFERFVTALPKVDDLAAAEEQQVLKLWEGLGYYRRARQLHAAAQMIVTEHGGQFPRDPQAVRALPGIGRYTAGAILSIAFDAREPILEANTIRLLSRLAGYQGEVAKRAGQQLLWQAAEELLPRRETGIFNQALMELGSRVCTPRNPGCESCPVAILCVARAKNLQHEIPRSAPRPVFEEVREAAIVVRHRGRVLVRRCAAGERWAGLWDFPRFTVEPEQTLPLAEQIAGRVKQLTGVQVEPREHLTTLRHGVTRFRITLECHAARYLSGPAATDEREMRWVEPHELSDLPLSTTGRKLSRLISQSKHGEPQV